MNTNLTIKNFRVFDEEGVTIELKPLTILTGCNSSGKSSVVKAVLLLNDFAYLEQRIAALEPNGFCFRIQRKDDPAVVTVIIGNDDRCTLQFRP